MNKLFFAFILLISANCFAQYATEMSLYSNVKPLIDVMEKIENNQAREPFREQLFDNNGLIAEGEFINYTGINRSEITERILAILENLEQTQKEHQREILHVNLLIEITLLEKWYIQNIKGDEKRIGDKIAEIRLDAHRQGLAILYLIRDLLG